MILAASHVVVVVVIAVAVAVAVVGSYFLVLDGHVTVFPVAVAGVL